MFPWNIAKSAEAMLSRWAVKRVCKFVLKKKLGKFILGDIDLDQLDVQLTAGTLQLSHLALNVDYLNQKLGAKTALNVKEGSIGSLLVTMPWKEDGCRIEVDELELVLCLRGESDASDGNEACSSGRDGSRSEYLVSGKQDHDGEDCSVRNNMFDVHEGVKTVAKMVKWLLTSFHVKVRKLIVAFDPCTEEGKNEEYYRALVLRIAEVECGVRISDDNHSRDEVPVDNFLGFSYLTNFVTFEGAVLEFLQLNTDNQTPLPSTLETTIGRWISECCPLNSLTPIITGKNGGFSGNLKLSIPWKNGSLDVNRVDGDAHLDPLEVRFHPGTIKSFICLWDILKNIDKKSIVDDGSGSTYYSAASNCGSSTLFSSLPTYEGLPSDRNSLVEKELTSKTLLSESHLISDWVNRSQKKSFDEESDFGESVHQFFECFDGLRNSQSVMGNSGVWNWTCSVFSAITAATNLASGSLHIPSEQQHTETNFKATAAGISLWFSFIDETNLHHSCMNSNANSSVDYGDANFQEIVLVLQVSPKEVVFETTVKHIELSHHFSSKIELPHMNLMSHNDVIQSQVASMRKVRDGISSSLPPFCAFKSKPDVVDSAKTCSGNYRDDVIKVPLLETSSSCHCKVRVNSSSNDFLIGPTSFSLKLPDLVFWVDIDFISAVLDLFKEMGDFYDMISPMSAPADFKAATLGDESIPPCATSSLRKENLRGDISLSDARIIIYSATKKCPDYGSESSCLVVDIKKRTTLRHEKIKAPKARPVGFQEKYALASSCSLDVNFGDGIAYLITPALKIDLESESSSKHKTQFIAHKIVSVADGADLPVISMFWQEDHLTGPWIAKRAKVLASAENIRNKDGFNGKNSEFASVSKVNDIEDFDHRSRQEMTVSSKFVVYARLPPVRVSLDEFIYGKLCHLLHHLIHDLSHITSDLIVTAKEYAFNQQSVLVECDSLEISLTMEVAESVEGSIQCELPVSWESLRLKVWNFELFSVSNVGGIEDASFIMVSHRNGDLLGSITGAPGKEFILISCTDSAVGRGAGEGSNVLSPRHSGSDIVHFWDPENSLSSLSITVRCGTIAAIGGRLDWLEAFFSFLASYSKIEEEDDTKLEKDKESVPTGSAFVLNLVDIALSYEPYTSNPTNFECLGNEFFGDFGGSINQKVACLLAASSLNLSNEMSAGSLPANYRIRVQDIGLLLSVDSGFRRTQNYSVEHLRKSHYVKVAQEAHIEALLRTNCDNGCLWEVECSDSHIVVNTCHDTASGLMRLAAQVQQLFAPDMEESAVHLQNRWNIIQQTHETNENGALSGNCASSDSHFRTSNLDSSSNHVRGNLMDQICDDAFQLIGTYDSHADTPDSSFHLSLTDCYLDEPCSSDVSDPNDFIGGFPITSSKLIAGVGDSTSSMSQENIPQLIEEYFLSDLRPLSNLRTEAFQEVRMNRGDAGGGSNRWYESTVKVLDDHVTDSNKQNIYQVRVDHADSSNVINADGFDKIKGRILLKNMNVAWRMFGGSDWHDQKGLQHSSRDTQTCLELCLSGIEFKYDALPDGGINLSRLCLTIRDICLNDNSNDAAWKLVLGYYKSKKLPRRSSSKALNLELESIRPDPSIPLEEFRLRVSLLPMRLHLHQTQLDFLINFFGGNSASAHILQDTIQDLGGSGGLSTESINLGNHTIIQEALQPYFQKFDVSPVLIRVDYSPCHVDLAALRSGKYVELVNLVPWKGVELQLKRVQAVGIYGWNRVCETIIGEWLEDISQNQVHKLLKGLPPIRSLVAVGSGAAKLVTLPVRNYRKENRLVKGMQRGTIAFLRSISLEAIGLGVHLAAGAHEVLLQAEHILTTIPPSVPCLPQRGMNTILKSNQPNDARQGIWQAYESISDGISKSASALVQAPFKKYQRGGGVGSAIATAVQAAPAAALSPASATARAVHCALLGVRNSLDPEHKKESLDKYLGKNQASEFM
ncbi:hypothetical protein LIER_22343 [Lithospermum erythrorhizon]|uniref:Autophagy-related protein 2 n=1 Tax=Lithospermum erythrorhizon TaxID=34254 RepID=A0AAV3QWL0_LITER